MGRRSVGAIAVIRSSVRQMNRISRLEDPEDAGIVPLSDRSSEVGLPVVADRGSPALRSVARRQALARAELGDRLRELVGPTAPATDPLIRSRTAFEFALARLADADQAGPR